MPLQPSMAVFSWYDQSLDEALGSIAALGLKHVDLGVFPDRYQIRTDEVLADPSSYAERVQMALCKHRLRVADIFFHPGVTPEELAPNHPDPDCVDEATRRLNAVLQLALELGAPHVTTLPGVPWGGNTTTPEDFERSVETLSDWVEQAEGYGVTLAVEAHMGSIIERPMEAVALTGAVRGLGLTLDPSHFICEGVAYKDTRILASLATHAHLRPACVGMLQCALEENIIPFEAFLKMLDASRCPSAAIELVRPRPLCDAVDVADTARRMLTFFPSSNPPTVRP